MAARVTQIAGRRRRHVCTRVQPLAELTSTELGKARADYLSAAARVTLADAALERKRGLAAEKIVPSAKSRKPSRRRRKPARRCASARAAIGAFGVEPPAGDEDGCHSSTFVLRVARARGGHRTDGGRRPDAGPGGAGLSNRRPLDALVDGPRLRARRRADRAGRRAQG